MANIDDVAREAGVSKSTVSNVFSKKRPISKEVTERVLAAAKKLNYKPNFWAKSLATKETRIIGLSMPGEHVKFSQFHLSLLNGVLKECYERGYRLLVNTLSAVYQKQLPYMASDPVMGEILLDPRGEDERIKERIQQRIPIVVIGKPPKRFEAQITYVDNDNVGAVISVTERLLDLGHRKILFLNAPKERTVAVDREEGFRLALERSGLRFDPRLMQNKEEKESSLDYGLERMLRLFRQNPEITAVITDTERIAAGVYRAIQQLGLRIPQDISVLSFGDDVYLATELNPPLSTLRLNGELLGIEAAKHLLEQIPGETKIAKRIFVPTEWVERGSVAEAPQKTEGGLS